MIYAKVCLSIGFDETHGSPYIDLGVSTLQQAHTNHGYEA